MRRWIGLGVGIVGLLVAGPASAQSHYLLAQTNGSFNGEATSDPDVSRVEHLQQDGVGGVDPSYYALHATTDSASGSMAITGSWSLVGGAADPIQPPASYASATRIEQDLDPGTPLGDTVTVHATLSWSGSAQTDSPTNVERNDLTAQLRLGGCQAYDRETFYSNGLYESNPIDCSNSVETGTAGPALIRVTGVYPSAGIDSFTRFHLDAQLTGGLANTVEYGDSGEYSVFGTLTVEVQGVDGYSYASPTFLTVPEPDGAGAAAALAGVLALARKRRA